MRALTRFSPIRQRPAVALALMLAASLFVSGLSPLSRAPKAAAQPVAEWELVPFGDSGWSYKQVDWEAESGFEAPTYSTAGFSAGTAPFGSTGTCAVAATVVTPWDINKDLLLRREIRIPPGQLGVYVKVVVDNDVTVYWNGSTIESRTHENCAQPTSPFVITIPPSQLSADGQNLLAIRARDRGLEAFLNIQVTYTREPGLYDGQTYGSCAGGLDAQSPTGCQSDPVNSATGAFVTHATDATLHGGQLPFVLSRSYTSADATVGPLGRGWTHSYAASLTEYENGDVLVRNEQGQQVYYTKDGSDYVPDPGGRSVLTKTSTLYKLARRDGSELRFDLSGRLTEIRDRSGNTQTLAYDGQGRLASVTDSASRTVTFTHNTDGRLTGIDLPGGRTASYSYTSGLLTQVTDLRGNTIGYDYDAAGRLTKITNQASATVVENVYGSNGRVASQKDSFGNESTFSWNATTKTASMTDARGKVWRDIYASNVLVERIDPEGNSTKFGHDDDLNLNSVTDPEGNQWRMTYDADGDLASRIAPAPLSFTESFISDANHNVTSATDARGKITTFTYDAAGRLTKITRPGGIETSLGYGASGSVTEVTDPRGKTTSFVYDASGRLTSVEDPAGAKTTFAYDSAGRLTSMVEPRGNETGATPSDYEWTFAYDAADNRTSQTDPVGNETTQTFDLVGRLKTRTDAQGHTTTWSYNAAGELAKVTAPDGTETSYGYDDSGNLVTRTDAEGHVTTYAYDDANRLVRVTSPGGKFWTYTYDGLGRVIKVIDANGNSTAAPDDGRTSLAYDKAGRVTSLDYSDGSTLSFEQLAAVTDITYSEPTPTVDFTHDPAGNRTAMSDRFGTESRIFDDLGRLTRITRGGDVFRYAYDAAGNVTSRIYPDGREIAYTYDDQGRLATVTEGSATTSYTYDAAGHLTRVDYPNGVIEARTWDRARRLSEVRHKKGSTTLWFATYERDDAGNPTKITSTDGVATYKYDQLDRLTEVCYQTACTLPTDPFIRWQYDDVGNRTTEQRPLGATSYTYDQDDRIATAVAATGTTTYAHDANGNLVRAGDRRFAYDAANRVSVVADGERTVTYAYDGEGKRIKKEEGLLTLSETEQLQTTTYSWDPNAALPLLIDERPGATDARRQYAYGLGLLSLRTGGENHYYHEDGIGSIAGVTNSSGEKEWSYSYEPFGAKRTETPAGLDAPANPMRFTGQYLDGATGLYHLRAREYDSQLGRFTQTDPLAPALSDPYVSAYVYTNNRPLYLVDPSGLRGQQGGGPGVLDILNEMFTNPWQSWWEGKDLVPTWFWWVEGAAAGGALLCIVASGLCTAAVSAAIATGQQTLAITGHAISRAVERGVTLAQIERVIQTGQRIIYHHQGVWKTGYYDAASRLFVATKGGTVITVITDVPPQYLTNLTGGG